MDAFNGQGSNAEAVVPLDSMYRNIRNIIREERPTETEPKVIQVNVQAGSKTIAQAIFNEYGKILEKNQRDRKVVRG